MTGQRVSEPGGDVLGSVLGDDSSDRAGSQHGRCSYRSDTAVVQHVRPQRANDLEDGSFVLLRFFGQVARSAGPLGVPRGLFACVLYRSQGDSDCRGVSANSPALETSHAETRIISHPPAWWIEAKCRRGRGQHLQRPARRTLGQSPRHWLARNLRARKGVLGWLRLQNDQIEGAPAGLRVGTGARSTLAFVEDCRCLTQARSHWARLRQLGPVHTRSTRPALRAQTAVGDAGAPMTPTSLCGLRGTAVQCPGTIGV